MAGDDDLGPVVPGRFIRALVAVDPTELSALRAVAEAAAPFAHRMRKAGDTLKLRQAYAKWLETKALDRAREAGR